LAYFWAGKGPFLNPNNNKKLQKMKKVKKNNKEFFEKAKKGQVKKKIDYDHDPNIS
jgi:hypothetical protein